MESMEKSMELFDNYKQEVQDITEKLADIAKPSSVFSKPSKVGNTSVITASEVFAGMGVGFGIGSGEYEANEEDLLEDDEVEVRTGMGGVIGGGGGANARPVAVIEVNEDGVFVQPVVDGTKIALAFFTTLGSMFFMLSKMRK